MWLLEGGKIVELMLLSALRWKDVDGGGGSQEDTLCNGVGEVDNKLLDCLRLHFCLVCIFKTHSKCEILALVQNSGWWKDCYRSVLCAFTADLCLA